MKHLIILGDGMADWPAEQLDGKTLLEYSHTPHMDSLARRGRTGMLHTVPAGFHPGSEVANMSVLGYDVPRVYEGRGVLEAANIGIELRSDELALRCNLVCLEGDHIKNHSAGHITTPEAAELIDALNAHFAPRLPVKFYKGVQYRHVLVVKGGSKHVVCTPPHDVPGQAWRPLLVRPDVQAEQADHQHVSALSAAETAQLLNQLIEESQALLAAHPVNAHRQAAGKDAANSIWPWGGGYRPQMEPLSAKYPMIRRGAVISAVDLINGIGHYAGLRCIAVEGATGLFDTNYEGKVAAALDALRTDDFVFLHIEASDEAGHEGDFRLKQRTIEDLDRRVVGPLCEALAQWDEPVAIAVLPDHPTPCAKRTHTAEPVPFLMYYPGITPDEVTTFGERACTHGGCGELHGDEFMNLFMHVDSVDQ